MVRVGSGGCGYEQPLAATKRALAHAANTGFVRNEALLLVVMLMDEDDCSVREISFFGPTSNDLVPLSSFRCTRMGVECDEPIDEVGEETSCRPRSTPYLDNVSSFVEAMRIVRGDPARVAVAAIAGPPDVRDRRRRRDLRRSPAARRAPRSPRPDQVVRARCILAVAGR
ncbi:MAG: hypothetical protein AB7T06_44235 [Kofleriaceae bacterium]